MLFAVLFLDLDRFKAVNDSLGHAMGDQLLVEIARRLEKCLRSCDTLAWLGGDEFTCLLESIPEESQATLVAERIEDALAAPVRLKDQEVYPRVSIGIAISSPLCQSPEDLLRDADTAMYRAKVRQDPHHVIFNRQMHAGVLSNFELEQHLRRALLHGEFSVHYQPIVFADGGAIAGLEALLRWRHPRRGLVSSAEFLPLAEATGSILEIDT